MSTDYTSEEKRLHGIGAPDPKCRRCGGTGVEEESSNGEGGGTTATYDCVCRFGSVAEKALAFTLLVERFLRDDTGLPGVSESELADAMYDLRCRISATAAR